MRIQTAAGNDHIHQGVTTKLKCSGQGRVIATDWRQARSASTQQQTRGDNEAGYAVGRIGGDAVRGSGEQIQATAVDSDVAAQVGARLRGK